MPELRTRFNFASAPVSWGVGDFRDAAWDQPYQTILDEMAAGGYTGAELGPYGYFPTDAAVLEPVLRKKSLVMLSSFVPVPLGDPSAASAAVDQIRKVGRLLAALKAPYIVLADAQTPRRQQLAGRVPADGSESLNAEQWRNAARVVAEAERVAADFGLDLVFHPHVATFIETPREVDQLFEATAATRMGLCLDTGHCFYGGGDPVEAAVKFKHLLRYVHIKDINPAALKDANRKKLNFGDAVAAGVFSQIGKGCVDFPAFFRVLFQNGYTGWIVVEQDVKFGETATPPSRSMAASLEYLESVVSQLA
ncbi:MAG: TIM barrel protein [Terriglobia bacterium]